MMFKRSRIFTLIALVCLLLALLEFASLVNEDSNEPFLYWFYVNRAFRPPLALLGLFGVSVWFFTQRLFNWGAYLRPLAVALMIGACAVFSLLVPLMSVSNVAIHWQSAQTDQGRYHLYYQYAGLGAPNCEHVLTRCDWLGMRCQAIQSWEVAPVCLGDRAPIQLMSTTNRVTISINQTVVATFEESS